MNWPQPDKIDRTGKILIDANKAKTPYEAARFLDSLVLQVAVGPDIAHDMAVQAALATVVNVGQRAFHGGVNVHLERDIVLSTGWTTGKTASATVQRFGGKVVDRLADNRPTLALGRPSTLTGKPILHLTWRGWSGGVVESANDILCGDGIVPAGIASAALGVSEIFQQQLGATVPGRRDLGVSLWCPHRDWRDDDIVGPTLQYLPAQLWLLGLGHLGQAYAWTLGMLPYATPRDVEIGLVDFDFVVDGNIATQLLTTADDVGRRKTRVVASAFEDLGFRTRLVERAYDDNFRPVIHADPIRTEPTIALAGFHDIAPRRLLGNAGFTRVIDGGLGSGWSDYLGILVHSFPSAEDPSTAFVEQPSVKTKLSDAYEAEIARQVESGVDETVAQCGMLDIAGITVGASFVGAFASSIVVADILRLLHNGTNYSIVAIDLRDLSGLQAVPNDGRSPNVSPPFTRAQT